MINLILPAAGKSSRFSSHKPKWLLTHPKGNLMIVEALKCLDLQNVTNIYITVLKKHIDQYCKDVDLKNLFNIENKNITICILDDFTQSQSHTIFETIKINDIKGPIFIKDCDNYFNFTPIVGNYICYTTINDNSINNIHNKSFIMYNNIKQITNICEKKIISNNICVGGYSFKTAKLFINQFNNILKIKINYKELYISHLINACLLQNIIFSCKKIYNYLDWGTSEDWTNYCNSFKTLFVDIDGVLVKNSGQYLPPFWGTTDELKKNTDVIRDLYSTGKTKIILTTARKKEFKKITIQQLKKHNIPFDDIIFDLFHCKRYLINDFSITNPYPTSISINLERDNNNLNKYLKII